MMADMTDRDPAFMWETEALRASPQRVTETELDGEASPADARWSTLRDASRATGIPVETLRKWARRSTIPSYLAPTAAGTNIRMVDLDGIERRAADLGRAIQPDTVPQETSSADPEPRAQSIPAGTTETAPPVEAPPPGTMIVPIDAWNKMLNQLGNLHEAGQQLAVASERAAKAETEAKFLRERLAELRAKPLPQTQSPEPPAAPEANTSLRAATGAPEKVWQYLVRRVRDRG
jgi:hypothetical protein